MEKVEIRCRCKDCGYSEKINEKSGIYYCYFGAHESGRRLSTVNERDFCNNGKPAVEKVYENLQKLIGTKIKYSEIVLSFGDYEEDGKNQIRMSRRAHWGYDYVVYIDAVEYPTQFLFVVDNDDIIINVMMKKGDYFMNSVIEKMREDGYPYKIKGNGGYTGVLYGMQPLLDGDYSAVYMYPGGQCCHGLEEIEAYFEVVER